MKEINYEKFLYIDPLKQGLKLPPSGFADIVNPCFYT